MVIHNITTAFLLISFHYLVFRKLGSDKYALDNSALFKCSYKQSSPGPLGPGQFASVQVDLLQFGPQKLRPGKSVPNNVLLHDSALAT